MVVMRVIPFEVPTLDKLHLPRVIGTLAEAERGMILVTGVTGSGKSSTMASMVNHINTEMNKHIVTLENPIEFLHRDLQSSVTQREVGADTESFKVGLRASLRQDPDVILLGEMRDLETVDTAIKAAETGHVLISSLHTPDATTTIARIVAMFPPEEQDIARSRLADSLHAVVAQRLLAREDEEGGRCPALEIMICTPEIRDLIRDRSRVGEIKDHIADGRDQYGMQTFDQHLIDLVEGNVVTFEAAKAAATNPAAFEKELEKFRKQSKADEAKRAKKSD